MLDTDTKRRIDTCRDILVGKVPDPKSQVEQITIALIYKFMDDMDAEAEELGGKRTFFAGEYKQFGWSKLMAPNMGGFDVLALYSEAIQKMNENPGIPALFRDIFKNAYLPYRDPETLRIFLKEIDGFTYDHSEKLGDAFEYLLSVLGSQGDAGQFRTPRHIIDFMVEITDPKKGESILDPACGTAGFLISAWKHILKNNTKTRSGDQLTPDERKRLAANINGYDISPDMVRLSLVNMYLHGFTDPHIVEYDTLTSEEKWNEYADVILANPPFMSPKGGIKPHKRFSVQATRSEVLFVDYMAEHLTPNGRAAIIVPEGIIFQSQTAYKQLRKMLVDTSLVAVVSLPAGVFQPYSGVKTSILILDKSLAKRCDSVVFAKVENDGFGLGAQRRSVVGSDLPDVVASVKQWLNSLRHGDSIIPAESNTCLIVAKEKIAAKGEYNLSGERYRTAVSIKSAFKLVSLVSVCDLIGGGTPSRSNEDYWTNGSVKWISSKHITEQGSVVGYELVTEKAVCESSTGIAPKDSVILITRVSVGKFAYAEECYAINQDLTAVVTKGPDVLDPKFLFCVAKELAQIIEKNAQGIGVRGVTRSFLSELQIPLPPIEVQQEIVTEIEGYQKVIDGARAVLDNYRPHIPIDPEWPMVELREVCDVRDGTHDSPKYVTEGYPLITSKNLKSGCIDFSDVNLISREDLDAVNKRSKVDDGDILMPMIGTIGNPVIADASREYAVKNVALIKFHKDSKIINLFLKDVMASAEMQNRFEQQSSGSTQKFIPLGFIRSLSVPLPPLATQQAIVTEIEAEQALVNANRELITRFEKKVQATLARVWGEEAV